MLPDADYKQLTNLFAFSSTLVVISLHLSMHPI